ncbi:TerC/Alx family metal homeostasis membrane protein [Dokdonella sp.]|uniref:TerC/Alx family metal homeostasis membrane protein n=1 Tax=Dokdonella sp. TaxID=2291710 RepID=UPI0031C205B4|nr:TerC/Alx family metal homeostasis membrane protein [Dokdonella sp.]
MHSIATPTLWIAFAALVVVALVVDFIVLRAEGPHRVSMREALWWSLAWIALALAFNAALWFYADLRLGREAANVIGLEFFTGYLLEKSLAVDNIFVFLMIFSSFAVPIELRQRALMLGVLGALVLRGVMIFVGAALVARFDWILYIFGVFLFVTGLRMLRGHGEQPDIMQHPVLLWIRRGLHMTDGFHGTALSVVENGRRAFTPLFAVLVLIAVCDVIFAVDSIPAIFSVTTDPFIVLTSNVFAVLGLRALFFVLARMADKFHLLGYGLAATLIFIGTKMLIAGFWHMPISLALGVVVLLIGGSIVASLAIPPSAERE